MATEEDASLLNVSTLFRAMINAALEKGNVIKLLGPMLNKMSQQPTQGQSKVPLKAEGVAPPAAAAGWTTLRQRKRQLSVALSLRHSSPKTDQVQSGATDSLRRTDSAPAWSRLLATPAKLDPDATFMSQPSSNLILHARTAVTLLRALSNHTDLDDVLALFCEQLLLQDAVDAGCKLVRLCSVLTCPPAILHLAKPVLLQCLDRAHCTESLQLRNTGSRRSAWQPSRETIRGCKRGTVCSNTCFTRPPPRYCCIITRRRVTAGAVRKAHGRAATAAYGSGRKTKGSRERPPAHARFHPETGRAAAKKGAD